MLTMNEAFVNILSSIEDKQMSCYTNPKVWIRTHLFITYFIELTFLYIYLLLYWTLVFLIVFNPGWYRFALNILERYYSRVHYDGEEKKKLILIYSIGLLVKEAILICIYVFFSYMYTWFVLVHDKNQITSMKFRQWLIEASYIQVIFIATCCVGTIDNFIRLYRSFTILNILVKIPVFVLMRYAETEKNFFLNDIKAHIFHKLC